MNEDIDIAAIEAEEDQETLRLCAVGIRAKAKQAMAKHAIDSPFSKLFVLTAEEAAFLDGMDEQGEPS